MYTTTAIDEPNELRAGASPPGVRFPSGETLSVTGGDIAPNGEHWDPNNTGNPLLDTSDRSTRLAVSFIVGELASSGSRHFAVARIDGSLVRLLQAIRDHVGRPVRVTSGYRSWAYNKDVYRRRGKKPTKSRHCSGQAADIRIRGLSGLEIAKAAIDVGGPRLGLGIGSNFAHVDVRGRPATWSYIGGAGGRDAVTSVRAYARAASLHPTDSPATRTVRIRPAEWGGWRGLGSTTSERYRFDDDWQDRVLAAVSSVEGGFDKVNAYDKGILSWGISQWSAHQGSLLGVLRFTKGRVGDARFRELFGGLGVDEDGYTYRGRQYRSRPEILMLFKGSANPQAPNYTRTRMWVEIFALAGREPDVKKAQRAAARRKLSSELDADLGASLARTRRRCDKKPPKAGSQLSYMCRRLPKDASHYRSAYGTVREYLGRDPVGVALYYGMLVQNPTWARLEFKRAIDSVAKSTDWSTNAADWPSNSEATMSATLERILRGSTIATWGDAKARKKNRSSRTKKLLKALRSDS